MIITGLVQITLVLMLLGLVGYEAGAVVVNAVQLDQLTARAARTAAATMRTTGSPRRVGEAVDVIVADEVGVVVEEVVVDRHTARVGLSRQPPFVVLDRVPIAGDLLTRRSVHDAPVVPQALRGG